MTRERLEATDRVVRVGAWITAALVLGLVAWYGFFVNPASIRGRVVLADGAPAAGLWVRLTSERPYRERDYSLLIRSTEIDADGSFSIARLPVGWYQLTVERESGGIRLVPPPSPKARGQILGYRGDLHLGAGRLDVGELRLEEPGAIEGVLLGADGAPLGGIEIKPGVALANWNRFEDSARTDADGRFRFHDMMPGSRALVAALPDAMARTHRFGVEVEPGETATCVLDLSSEPWTRTVRFVEPEGRPIAGAWVYATGPATRDPMIELRTDQDGVVTLLAVEPGPLDVRMGRKDLGAFHFELDLGDAGAEPDEPASVLIADGATVEVELDADAPRSWEFQVEAVALDPAPSPYVRPLVPYVCSLLEPGETSDVRLLQPGRYRLLCCETRRRIRVHAPADYDELADEPWIRIVPFTVARGDDRVRVAIEVD